MSKPSSLLSPDRIRSAGEILSKVSFSIIGGSYAMGLAVVNIHLNNYGVYNVGLLRVNYITAGIWATIPILLSTVFLYGLVGLLLSLNFSKANSLSSFLLLNELSGETDNRDFISLTILGNFLLLLVFVMVVGWLVRIRVSWIWVLSLITGCLVALSLRLILKNMASPIVHADPKKYLHITLIAIITTLILFIHILVFASRVYSTIPSYVGGGGAKRVQMIVDEDKNFISSLQSAGITFQDASTRTSDILLLFVTDQDYIVLIKSPDRGDVTPVSIRRDLVKLILYFNSE